MIIFKQRVWDVFDGDSKMSPYYDLFMMVVIVVSLVPLIFKNETEVLMWIDHIAVAIFIIDYILRWLTAERKFKKGKKSYLLYVVSPWAILDLVCILPSFQLIARSFRILKVARLSRTLRVFRSFKLLRGAKNVRLILDVIKRQWKALMTVIVLAVGYVLIVALIMFNMEPDTFDSFFHSVYWATISLTTIGYGDVYPQSVLGQAVTIISAFIGIAVIALPSGIIAGAFMNEIGESKDGGTNDVAIVAKPDTLDRIEKLGELRDNGVLTEEEFSSSKTKLLELL